MHLLLHTALVETEGSEPNAQTSAGSTDQAETELFFNVIEQSAGESSAPKLEGEKVESDNSGTRDNAVSLGALSVLVARYAEAETNATDDTFNGDFHRKEVDQTAPDKQSEDASVIDDIAIDGAKSVSLPLEKPVPFEAVERLEGSGAPTPNMEEPQVRSDQPVELHRASLSDVVGSRQSEVPRPHKVYQSLTEHDVKEPRQSGPPDVKAAVASQLVPGRSALLGSEEASEINVLNSRDAGEVVSFNQSNSESIRNSANIGPMSTSVDADIGTTVGEDLQRNAGIGTLPVSEVPFSHLRQPTPSRIPGSQIVEQKDISKRAKHAVPSKFFSEVGHLEKDRDDARNPADLSQRAQTSVPLLNANVGLSEQNKTISLSQSFVNFDQVISRDTVHESLLLSSLTTSAAEEVSTSLSTARVQPEPVNARSIVSQVLQSITRVPGENSIELRLQPEELGRVRLTLLPVDGGVSVQISAERSETLELLRRNVEMLESELRKHGFSDASFSFGSDLPQEKAASDEWSSQAVEEDAPSKISVELASTPVVDGSGRLDIRV